MGVGVAVGVGVDFDLDDNLDLLDVFGFGVGVGLGVGVGFTAGGVSGRGGAKIFSVNDGTPGIFEGTVSCVGKRCGSSFFQMEPVGEGFQRTEVAEGKSVGETGFWSGAGSGSATAVVPSKQAEIQNAAI